MKYTQESFSIMYGSKEYSKNWEATFKPKRKGKRLRKVWTLVYSWDRTIVGIFSSKVKAERALEIYRKRVNNVPVVRECKLDFLHNRPLEQVEREEENV